MDAIILCGGLGKRMRPKTETIPKAMVEVNGNPLIDYQISWLKRNGIKRIVLACGYKWELLKDHLKDSVSYAIEKEPLGTAGAVRNALKHVTSESFVVCNVDDLSDISLKDLEKIGPQLICLSQFRCPFGVVHTDNDRVIQFEEKPLLNVWVSMGVYLLNKSIVKCLPEKGDLEKEVFPKLELKAYKHTGMWVTANTEKDIDMLSKMLK